jgi:UDP-N-acetylglucosamine pyrophosphorylase
MTSEATMEQTRSFFEKHHFFGLDGANVFFFEQNTVPCVTEEGKVHLSALESVSRIVADACADHPRVQVAPCARAER